MPFVITFIVLAFFSACSFFKAPLTIPRPKGLVTGKDFRESNPSKIKSALILNDSMAGGEFKLSVFPLTRPYIEMNERAWNKKHQALSAIALEKTIRQQQYDYSEKRSCFKVHLDVGKFKKMADFKRWKGVVKGAVKGVKDISSKMRWSERALQAEVLSHTIKNFQGRKKNYTLQGVICAHQYLALEEGASFELRPDWIPFPFDDHFKVAWEFDESIKKGGGTKKVKRKKKKRHPWQ